jgi:hypothetical protein
VTSAFTGVGRENLSKPYHLEEGVNKVSVGEPAGSLPHRSKIF